MRNRNIGQCQSNSLTSLGAASISSSRSTCSHVPTCCRRGATSRSIAVQCVMICSRAASSANVVAGPALSPAAAGAQKRRAVQNRRPRSPAACIGNRETVSSAPDLARFNQILVERVARTCTEQREDGKQHCVVQHEQTTGRTAAAADTTSVCSCVLCFQPVAMRLVAGLRRWHLATLLTGLAAPRLSDLIPVPYAYHDQV
eukprot:SAG11_NODE_10945_length_794_cov_1.243165_1_plen_201_part_00